MSHPDPTQDYTCEADHDNLKPVDDIMARSASFIIWSARLDVKCAIAQLEACDIKIGLEDLKAAKAKLELLKV